MPAGGPPPTESLIRPAMTTSPMSRAWTSAARSSAPLGRSRTQALSSSGGVGGKSQTKSQRPSARGIIQPHSATVIAARCLIQLQRATSSDRKDTPYKREATGSNPVAPTRAEQQRRGLTCGNAVGHRLLFSCWLIASRRLMPPSAADAGIPATADGGNRNRLNGLFCSW